MKGNGNSEDLFTRVVVSPTSRESPLVSHLRLTPEPVESRGNLSGREKDTFVSFFAKEFVLKRGVLRRSFDVDLPVGFPFVIKVVTTL